MNISLKLFVCLEVKLDLITSLIRIDPIENEVENIDDIGIRGKGLDIIKKIRISEI